MSLTAFGLYFCASVGLVAVMLLLSWALGERHRETATDAPFESGVLPVPQPGVRLSIQYYVPAMLFLVFDLEAIYLLAWAVSARTLGWTGVIEMLIFTAVLGVAILYLWRMGALDVGTQAPWRRRRRAARRQRETTPARELHEVHA